MWKPAKDDKGSLTYERVRELFNYDEYSGNVYWKINRSTRRKAGDPAGWLSKESNRWFVEIDGCNYRLHRIIWCWKTGSWPEYEIDHIDKNPANNAWNNLREANHSQNNCNRSAQSNNKLGVRGVSYTKRGRYQVRVNKNGVNVFSKCFKTLDEAVAAHREAITKYHGEFARLD